MQRKPLIEVYGPKPTAQDDEPRRLHQRTFRPDGKPSPAATEPSPRPPRAVSVINPPRK